MQMGGHGGRLEAAHTGRKDNMTAFIMGATGPPKALATEFFDYLDGGK